MREEQIYTVFNEFDTDNSGYITKRNFYDALKKSGNVNVNKAEVDNFFKNNDKIYYENFKEMVIGEKNSDEMNKKGTNVTLKSS
jgi:Ca2+-binding EF-hand superfamily protein